MYNVYTTFPKPNARQRLKKAGFEFVDPKPYSWSDVGQLTIDLNPKLPENKLQMEQTDCPGETLEPCAPQQRLISMGNELDDTEAAQVIEEDTPRFYATTEEKNDYIKISHESVEERISKRMASPGARAVFLRGLNILRVNEWADEWDGIEREPG